VRAGACRQQCTFTDEGDAHGTTLTVVVLILVVLTAVTAEVQAQAPAPKVTINGLFDQITSGGRNIYDGNEQLVELVTNQTFLPCPERRNATWPPRSTR